MISICKQCIRNCKRDDVPVCIRFFSVNDHGVDKRGNFEKMVAEMAAKQHEAEKVQEEGMTGDAQEVATKIIDGVLGGVKEILTDYALNV